MRRYFILQFVVVFALSARVCAAQPLSTGQLHNGDSSIGSTEDYSRLSYFTPGLNVLSDNVYNGRHDTNAAPFITPSLSFHYRNGLFGTASLSYAPKQNKIALYTLTAGYQVEREDYEWGVAASKYFYNNATTTIRSGLTADIDIYGTYTGWWLVPNALADILFGRKATDYVAGLGLSHRFFLERQALLIEPAFYVSGGTQQYYASYFARKKKAATETVVLDNPQQFRLLNYELKLDVEWERGPFVVTFAPVYDIPVSPAKASYKSQYFEEQLSNIFWIQLDAVWRLKMK
jgi:hypothetical protein